MGVKEWGPGVNATAKESFQNQGFHVAGTVGKS